MRNIQDFLKIRDCEMIEKTIKEKTIDKDHVERNRTLL